MRTTAKIVTSIARTPRVTQSLTTKLLLARSLVHVKDLKSTYSPFAEMKHLSPFHGAVLNDTQQIEKLYDKAITGKTTSAMHNVVKELFHKNYDQFKHTVNKSLPAYYLTPELVARLLHYLNKNQLAEPHVRKELYAEWRKLVTGGDKLSQVKIDSFLDKMIAAKNECVAKKYHLMMTESVLLAFLNSKADQRKNIMQYLAEIGRLNPTAFNKEKLTYHTSSFDKMDKIKGEEVLSLIAFAEDKDVLQIIEDNYEAIMSYLVVSEKVLPKAISSTYSHMDKPEKTDCMETALRNLYNILLFDGESGNFNFNLLPKSLQVSLNNKMRAFYHMQDFKTDKINQNAIGKAFFDMVSGNESFRYVSDNYELDATPSNVLAVTNTLFGTSASSFKELSEQFSDERRRIVFEQSGDHVHISICKNGIELEKLELKCAVGRHAHLVAPRFSMGRKMQRKSTSLLIRVLCSIRPQLAAIIDRYPMLITAIDEQYNEGSVLLDYVVTKNPHKKLDKDIIKALSVLGKGMNVVDHRGDGLLHRPLDPETLKMLLELGADPMQRNIDDETPLFFAKDPDSIHILIQAGVDPKVVTSYGATPLHKYDLDTKVIQLLLSLGVDPNITCNEVTALHFVGLAQKASVLIAAGADVNACFAGGTSLLHYFKDNFEVFEVLLKAGANPNVKDGCGNTPLHKCRTYDAIKALLDAGADPHALNKEGKKPIDTISTVPWDIRSKEIPLVLKAAMESRVPEVEKQETLTHLRLK